MRSEIVSLCLPVVVEAMNDHHEGDCQNTADYQTPSSFHLSRRFQGALVLYYKKLHRIKAI